MEKVKLINEYAQWADPEKVKIGKCNKCSNYMSVGWLFPHMTQYYEFCFACNKTTRFKVQSQLKYIAPIGAENGYVSNGISHAINAQQPRQ